MHLFRPYQYKLCIFLAILSVSLAVAQPISKPNVVFIICDDLNDFSSVFGGHPQAITPNMSRLAKKAVTFQNAYTNNPVCAPSRASLYTGIYPHTSNNLFWAKWYENPILKNSKTMMEFFRENGYRVIGTGKNEHHHRPTDWDFYKAKTDYGPYWSRGGKDRSANPWVPHPFADIGAIDGSFGPLRMDYKNQPKGAGWKYRWGKERLLNFDNSNSRDRTPDEMNAQWAADTLKEHSTANSSQPLFMAIGFVRPHTPLHVPQEFFDRFPKKDLELYGVIMDDASDTYLKTADPSDGKGIDKGYYYYQLLEESYGEAEAGVKAFLRAYLACVAAVDACIGTVVDAVDQNGLSENTIIIVTSDHGWDMGQKGYIFKNTLWEDSTRIPLLVRAPGVSKNGYSSNQPVSLIDLYPTLVDLCDLKGDTRKNSQGAPLDGYSMRPLLSNPQAGQWEGPKGALTMRFAGPNNDKVPAMQHWAYRTERYRYIIYNDGNEELYDHHNDPNEWFNLALQPKYTALKAEYKQAIFEHFPNQEDSQKLKERSTDQEQAKAKFWKDRYFKRHPSADSNGDGVLSWPEFQQHKNNS
jgi:arylsulfatase A-like enzyme